MGAGKKRKYILSVLMAVCMAVTCVIAQTPGMSARAADPGKIDIILDNITGGYAAEAAGGKVLVSTTKGDYKEIDGSGGFTEVNPGITVVGTNNGKKMYTITAETLYLKLDPNSGKTAKVNVPGGTAPSADGDSVYTLTAGTEYHVEFENSGATSGPEPGEGGEGRTAQEGEVMSAGISLMDGTYSADFTIFLFNDDGTQSNEWQPTRSLSDNMAVSGDNPTKLDLAAITSQKVNELVYCGNLVEGGKLNLYSLNPKTLTGSIDIVSNGTDDGNQLYKTSDNAVEVIVEPKKGDNVARTTVRFKDFTTSDVPFQFRTDYSSPNYAKYGLEYHPYAEVVRDKGQEEADKAFKALATDQDNNLNEDELKVIQAVPGFYLASFCLYKDAFRGIKITTGRMPSMYDFTTPDTVPLENSPAEKADEVTAYYGEGNIFFMPAIDADSNDPNAPKVYQIKKIEPATVNGVTIPAGAVRINDDNTVTVRSGFFAQIPLKITLDDDTAGYVLVNRIGIDITTGAAGSDSSGWTPLHGASQSGAKLEDTQTVKYSTAKNLVATFYFNKEGSSPEDVKSYKDYDMIATLTYPDGTKEVRTVKGYGEVECESQWGPNGIMGGDYLIWSSAVDTGDAPVSVSVTAVRASSGSSNSFAGAMFGNGMGVTKNDLQFGPSGEEGR